MLLVEIGDAMVKIDDNKRAKGKSGSGKRGVYLTLDRDLLDALDEAQRFYGFASRSDLIRFLLRLGVTKLLDEIK